MVQVVRYVILCGLVSESTLAYVEYVLAVHEQEGFCIVCFFLNEE